MSSQNSLMGERAPQQDRSRKTQQAILAATEELMRSRPFDQISVAEIANAAGVSVGNFYNRFSDKTALLLTMFQSYQTERTEFLLQEFEIDHWQGTNLETRAQAIAELLVEFFWARRALVRSFVLYHRNAREKVGPSMTTRLKRISLAGAMVLADAMESDSDAIGKAKLGLQTTIALCREFILFGDEPSKRALGLSRNALTKHLTQVLLGCLV